METILVVDDEEPIVELVAFNLKGAGFQVEVAYDGQEALEKAREKNPDLVILDLMLPELDGLEVCRRLRLEGNYPILMLTARSDEVDRVLGLELGADDYLTKPFSPRELVARVKAILRRRTPREEEKETTIRRGDLEINPSKHRVQVKGREVELTPKEYKLLEIMARRPGHVYSRELLLELVWDYDFASDSRTVDVHIRHLREKVEPDPANPYYVQTVRGVGYRFRE